MKQSVQRDGSQVSKIIEPTRSRPAQQKTSASGSHLAQLAAMINASPKAESLVTLAAEINQQRPRQAGGAESGVNRPAQLRLEVEGTLAHGDRSGNSIIENTGGESADTGGQSATQSSCGCSAKANSRSGSKSESLLSRKLPAQKKDAARSQAATQKAAQRRAVLQAVWAYLDVEGGESLNLKQTSDLNVFERSSDGSKYVKTGTASDGRIIVKRQGGVHADWRYDKFDAYKDWTQQSQGVSVPAPFGSGNINAAHNRGAPKASSRQEDFGGAKLGDKYSDYVSGLQSGGKKDAQIAQALLDLDDTNLVSDLEKRAASMLHVTVYLAEEWRKQGAAKLYRAFLRSIVSGEKDFNDFLTEFKFIVSADEGRKQVARFADVHRGVKTKSDLDADEQIIYGNMSPIHDEDVESDSDMEVEKALGKTRDHSQKNKGSGIGWKDPWKT
jgi:hypothetical protein